MRIDLVTKACAWSTTGEKAYFDGDAIRWDSNDNVPPKEVLRKMVELDEITEEIYTSSVAAEQRDLDAYAVKYHTAMANQTSGEKAEYHRELAEAFGPGNVIVDAITGERTVV